jgi:hypothetical protein
VDRCDKFNDCAVRVCYQLGLHRLPDDPCSTPILGKTDDSAFAGTSTFFRRHEALLLLHIVLAVDNENHRNPAMYRSVTGKHRRRVQSS